MKAIENSMVKLQRIVMGVKVTDGVGTEVRAEQEIVLPVARDQGIPIGGYRDVVPITGFQGIPAGRSIQEVARECQKRIENYKELQKKIEDTVAEALDQAPWTQEQKK